MIPHKFAVNCIVTIKIKIIATESNTPSICLSNPFPIEFKKVTKIIPAIRAMTVEIINGPIFDNIHNTRTLNWGPVLYHY